MSASGSGHRIVLLLATTVMIAVCDATFERQAQAQSAAQGQYNFNIRSKPIRQGLSDIGRITGLAVIFRETPAASAAGQPVSGSMTARQALSALLSGGLPL